MNRIELLAYYQRRNDNVEEVSIGFTDDELAIIEASLVADEDAANRIHRGFTHAVLQAAGQKAMREYDALLATVREARKQLRTVSSDDDVPVIARPAEDAEEVPA